MKRKKRGGRAVLRTAALALAVILAAVLLPELGTPRAAAFTSLEHIEYIKKNQKTFTILEIVPRSGTGSIGYYADGQEPVANWKAETGKLVGKSARENYVNGIASGLEERGLLASDASAPLTKTASYAEALPWEAAPADAVSLRLTNDDGTTRWEETTISAAFSYTGAGKGAFALDSTPTFRADGSGDYVQNVARFVHASADPAADGAYYYVPAFAMVVLDAEHPASSYEGRALYTCGTDGIYSFAGVLDPDGFTMEEDVDYYCVTADGAPSPVWSAETPYRAVPDEASPFTQVASGGYFTMSENHYTYVGDGKGDYTLTSGTKSYTVFYSTVNVTGNYVNNDWFLKNVFDAEDAAKSTLSIRVYSVLPTAAGLDGLLDLADMVVLSGGLDLSTGGDCVSAYTGSNDLTAARSAAIVNMAAAGKPVLLDSRVAGASAAQLRSLAAQLMNGAAAPFVSGSLYCFQPDTLRTALATNQFTLAFDAALSEGDAAPYSPVRSEIEYENFLRANASPQTDPLPTDITMANCIRYIVNYSGQRVQNRKTSIKVLDVEPQTPNDSDSGALKAATVQSWLPANSITVAQSDITTMSTAEFVSKIEDINEQYDLVYIGASLDRFYTTGTGDGKTTIYNDPDMAGLIYSNIGDLYHSQLKLSGLLDRDYSSAVFTHDGSQYNQIADNIATKTYRLSGNDITATRSRELQNFVNSGFPLVIADGLIAPGQAATGAWTLSVKAAGSVRKATYYGYDYYTVTLTAAPAGMPAGVNAADMTYQWYQDGAPVDGATASTYELQGYGVYLSASSYTCRVTYRGKTAVSNPVSLREGVNVPDSGTGGSSGKIPLISVSGQRKNRQNTYSVTVPSSCGTVTGYRWLQLSYSDWGGYYYWNQSRTSATLTTGNGTYLCRVTTNRGTYYSPSIQLINRGYSIDVENAGYYWYDGRDWQDPVYTSATTFNVTVTREAGATSSTGYAYRASVTPSGLGTPSYKWYYSGYDDGDTPVATGALCPVNGAGDYQCYVTLSGVSASSETFTATSGWTAAAGAGGTSAAISAQAATGYSISTARVDASSILYSTLSGVLSRNNVMSASVAAKQQNVLLKYLNLSKPSISFTSKPAEYAGNLSASLIGKDLKYTFTIVNPTDSTPVTTRYRCALYLDQNADGRYKDDEELTDLLISDASGVVEADELKAGETYTVTRTLPTGKFSGIIPWKLEVVKVGAEYIHASQHGYTYIKPTSPIPIKILQVKYKDIDLSTDETYKELYREIAAAYAVNVTAVTIGQLNSFAPNSEAYGNAATLKAYLDGFDMLVMGFGDMYGSLNKASADAVVAYIDSGKAILFTHDTTSFCNLPFGSYETDGGGTVSSEWGYYFNTILRDPVGLDRYGVTNPTYGITKYRGGSDASGLAASGYAGMTEAKRAELTGAGYSVAYKPYKNNTTFQTTAETQGFTKYELVRYSADTAQQYPTYDGKYSTDSYNNTTNAVSQVNEGQITTFPFNINTTDFDKTNTDVGATLSVAQTHDQYYQLNMNSEDVVVWYCLSGNNFVNAKNDGVNAYYIYNRGNVTYSGAGHTTDKVGSYKNEARLFVNTMIAAFRAGSVNPTLRFKSSDGAVKTSQFLPFAYQDSTSAVGSALEDSQFVYFTVSDPNLASNKKVSVQFFYEDAAGTADPELASGDGAAAVIPAVSALASVKIYRTDTGAQVTDGFRSDLLYRMELPNTLLNFFSNSEASTLKLYGKVVTTIGTSRYVGFSTLNLRKLGLLELR